MKENQMGTTETGPISNADIVRFMSDIAREGGTLYRKADDCGFSLPHWIGEGGKPCLDCGAEQIWVVPVVKEERR